MLKCFLHIGVVCVMLVGLVACTGSDENVQVQEEKQLVEVGITLVVDRKAESRGLTDGMDLNGTAGENYIDIENGDFRFYVFDTDNKPVSEIEVKNIAPINELKSLYYVRAEMENPPGANFKLVVLANWEANGATYPTFSDAAITDMEALCEASQYYYKYDDIKETPFNPGQNEKSIPMYGVHTYSGVTFHSDLETLLGEITLVRAMAKVEVKCEAEGYELVRAEMTHFSARGMAAPIRLYDDTENIKNKWADHMHVDHKDVVNFGYIPFLPVVNGSEADSTAIYVPEYKNTGAEYPSFITVKLKKTGEEDAQAKEYRIDFVDYVDGKPSSNIIDIWRNNYYQFVITAVGAGIDLHYRVADWHYDYDEQSPENSDNYWSQTFDYPTYEQVVPWAKKDEPHLVITPEDATMYYDASNWKEEEITDSEGNKTTQQVLNTTEPKGAFVAAFKMTGPTGHKWEPAIHKNDSEYGFVVSRLEGDSFVDLSDEPEEWVASEYWYRIQLVPKNPGSINAVVECGISTTLDFIGQSIFLLINGQDAQTTRWPGSSDARIIKVTQVAQPDTGTD